MDTLANVIGEESKRALPFIGAVVSLAVMVVLSALGATVGAVKSTSSVAMVANRGNSIITRVYLPVLLASGCFMYGFILTMMTVGRIPEDISIVDSGCIVCGTTVYGFTALFTGIAIGECNKKSIIQLSMNRHMFLPFIIINSTLEIPPIFAVVTAIYLLP
ncbi:V-type H+-transporting ATPase 16kDa proteolipid subunit [Nematocida sp. AWRm77]|nr:V-type H+-transporting ATPase 16kDa proteolipid subunit [Nematocida sp. AWRm77]